MQLSRRNSRAFIRAIGLAALFVVMMVFLAAVGRIYGDVTPERSQRDWTVLLDCFCVCYVDIQINPNL